MVDNFLCLKLVSLIKMEIEQEVENFIEEVKTDPLRWLFTTDLDILRASVRYYIGYRHYAPKNIGTALSFSLEYSPREAGDANWNYAYNLKRRSCFSWPPLIFPPDHHEPKTKYKFRCASYSRKNTKPIYLCGDVHVETHVWLIAELPEFTSSGFYDSCYTNFPSILIKKYGTPHVDEILILQLIPQLLPQPIAEAVLDCICGVIVRRFLMAFNPIYNSWSSKEAFVDEVIFTVHDNQKHKPDDCWIDSWEYAAYNRAQEICADYLSDSSYTYDLPELEPE